MISLALAELLADALLTYFCPRTDYFKIAYTPKNQHQPCTTSDPRSLLLGHLLGSDGPSTPVVLTEGSQGNPCHNWRVGVYPFGSDGLCKWVCIDCDGGEHHNAPLKDPLSAALKVYQKATSLGLPAYLEQSGSGSGWHIWIFFDIGINPELARTIGYGLCPSDAPLLKSSEMASVLLGKGLEVFPKAWQASPRGGCPIWLPWYAYAPKGANLFYLVEGQNVTPYPSQPTTFTRATYPQLAAAANQLPPTSFWKPTPAQPTAKSKSTKTSQPMPDIEKRVGGGLPSAPLLPAELDQTPGLEWRDKITLTAPLEVVYSPFLTGKLKTGGAWLECKDYRSGSGDEHPSAGVATGEDPNYPRGLWHSFRDGKSLSIFDYLIETTQAGVLGATYPDFKAAALYLAQLTNIPYPKRGANASGKDPTERLPIIFTSGQQLITIIGEARNAIHKANNPPALFCRSSELVTIQDNSIQKVSIHRINGVLYRVAQWHANQGDKVVVSKPPPEVGADLLTFVDDRMPPIERVIGSPIYSPSGVLCDSFGYHAEAKAYLTYNGYINAPSKPKQWEAEASAQWLLSEMFTNFDFATPGDATHAIGALLTPLVRDLIPGAVPLHDIGSPTGGCGKDLIVKSMSSVYMGQPVSEQTLPIKEEEIAKTILAEISQGQPIVLFTNADTKGRREIDSGTLEALFTSLRWKSRVLQTSEMSPEYPNRAIWFMTGVNLQFKGNLVRRRVRIKIDPSIERPHERPSSYFKRPGTGAQIAWCIENRHTILSHLITMVNYYLSLSEKDRPQPRAMGNFEEWSQVVGGIVTAAGLPGWMSFLDDPEDDGADAGLDEWNDMIAQWLKETVNEKTVADINSMCNIYSLMMNVRGDKSRYSQQSRLGFALKSMRSRIISGVKIVSRYDSHAKKTMYRLVELESSKPAPPPKEPTPADDDSEQPF